MIEEVRYDRSINYHLNEGDSFVIDEDVLTENEKIWYKDMLGVKGTINHKTFSHGYMVGYRNGYMVSFKTNNEYINAEIIKLAT